MRGTVQPLVLSPAQAAQALGLSRAAVYNMMARGELRSVKLGASRRIPVAELDRLIGEAS